MQLSFLVNFQTSGQKQEDLDLLKGVGISNLWIEADWPQDRNRSMYPSGQDLKHVNKNFYFYQELQKHVELYQDRSRNLRAGAGTCRGWKIGSSLWASGWEKKLANQDKHQGLVDFLEKGRSLGTAAGACRPQDGIINRSTVTRSLYISVLVCRS